MGSNIFQAPSARIYTQFLADNRVAPMMSGRSLVTNSGLPKGRVVTVAGQFRAVRTEGRLTNCNLFGVWWYCKFDPAFQMRHASRSMLFWMKSYLIAFKMNIPSLLALALRRVSLRSTNVGRSRPSAHYTLSLPSDHRAMGPCGLSLYYSEIRHESLRYLTPSPRRQEPGSSRTRYHEP